MKGSTVALIALGVAGVGAGVYFLVIRPRQLAQLPGSTAIDQKAKALTALAGTATAALGVTNTVAHGVISVATAPARIGIAALDVTKTAVAGAFAIPATTIKAAAGLAGTAVKATTAIPVKAVSAAASGAKSVVSKVASWF